MVRLAHTRLSLLWPESFLHSFCLTSPLSLFSVFLSGRPQPSQAVSKRLTESRICHFRIPVSILKEPSRSYNVTKPHFFLIFNKHFMRWTGRTFPVRSLVFHWCWQPQIFPFPRERKTDHSALTDILSSLFLISRFPRGRRDS